MNDQRLIDLETKFSFQEMTLEELQQTVHDQHIAITKLEKTLKLLTDQLKNGSTGNDDIRAGNEKPPHY